MSPTAMPGLIPLFCASSRVPAIDPCHRHSLKASDLLCSRDKPLGPRELIDMKNELLAFLCQPDDNKESLREFYKSPPGQVLRVRHWLLFSLRQGCQEAV